ncbi:hypothetical protein P4361_17335 [Fictibacillus sp. B-59209]|nr:hypothetical protein [Fictibacillus sp. B-59209]
MAEAIIKEEQPAIPVSFSSQKNLCSCGELLFVQPSVLQYFCFLNPGTL